MTIDLLDHTARLLEREPTRCMNITALHERAARETGTRITIGAFLKLLSRHAGRFVVIPGSRTAGGRAGWSTEDRADYDSALERAPGAASLVMLACCAPDPTLPATAGGGEDVLTAVYDALVDLLQGAGADEQLRLAAAEGARELDAVRHGLTA
ncbi:hypothetical protein BH23GEM10_BH23GEM10_16710 [soil metagenome]